MAFFEGYGHPDCLFSSNALRNYGRDVLFPKTEIKSFAQPLKSLNWGSNIGEGVTNTEIGGAREVREKRAKDQGKPEPLIPN